MMAVDILQWNIRGLKSNFHELSLLLNDINPNVICLQETKLSKDQQICLKGYHSYHHIYTHGEIACGGSSILVKKGILHKKLSLQTKLQASAVRVTLHRPMTICSIYIPPNKNPSLKEIEHLIGQLPGPFLLVGDFNAHNPLWGSCDTNQKGKTVEDLLLKNNICLLNDSTPTYVDACSFKTSCIDLSLCDPDLLPDFSWSVSEDLHGSDHFPILLSPVKVPKICFPKKWNFKKANWASFSSACQQELNPESEISSYDHFTEVLLSLCEKFIPKTSGKPRKNKCWFDEDCRLAIKDKKLALRKYLKSGSPNDLKNFKLLRAKARKILRNSKRTSFQKHILKINGSTPMSKVWKIVNKLRGTHAGDSIKHVNRPDNTVAESEVDVANTIATTLAQNSSTQNYTKAFIKHKNKTESKPVNFSSNQDEEYNRPFSLRELKLCIKDLSDSAPGPDQIHNKIIGHLPEESLKLLLTFYNDFWTNNTFPDSWRQATVVPIPKPGKDHSNPSNYRPISLTNCFCKLLEKLVNSRLMWYLEHNKCLTKYQSGFRSNRSTVDHLVRLETFIREAFARKEHIVAVFFDLEKAFDTTWKQAILKDLHALGLRGHLPMFVENFLAKRKFQVKVGSSFSESFDQEEGVPQGSILSPILFEVKIDSIVKTLDSNMDCSLYVDDFVICYRSKARMETIERQLQLQLWKLQEWADKNGFKFSPSKTTAVHFCSSYKCVRDPDLFLYKSRIQVKDSVRFLGVIFDKRLSFLPHIKDLRLRCQTAINALRVFCNPEWGGTSDVLLNLYRTLVRSRLDYACFIYGSACKSNLQILDPIHHQGIRLALGAFRTCPVESLLTGANEPPLLLRRERLDLQCPGEASP